MPSGKYIRGIKKTKAEKKAYMIAYMREYNKRPRNANLIGYVYDINGNLFENYVNHKCKK